ncbi:MAG: GntR family transcriptional regulator [Sphingomonadaceae bacterium]|uniref:GntR family transcriptional regulator n=1 Tax=Thermaurantiacus sp. TaxID=2820283 RepID=UPI00298ED429|nr:GntR family transcriptional regulator [Thermaurantiacus sp.]MCS6987191.1 GntR family transcriptional regulator [Sphingomonadaceae bacterium]MDW8415775.1 GntR family transcriptional regulator [Thermaurantiacus sp.]
MSRRPRYLEVAEALREDMRAQGLGPGAPLPTEAQLTDRFRVSRFTVREALRQLAAEGLIRRRRGSGTIVAAAPALRQALPDAPALLQYAAHTQFRLSPARLEALTPATARLLGRAAGERWYHLRGLRVPEGEGEPIAVTDVYIHPRFGPVVDRLASGREALFAQLGRLAGLEVGRVRQEIAAVAAGAADARDLRIGRGTPCLRIVRQYFDTAGEIAQMSCSVHPGERFTYIVDSQR